MNFRIALFLCFFNISFNSFSQQQTEIAGVWHGQSVCVSKKSSCKDEMILYRIKKKEKDGEYMIMMNRIVNGMEEEIAIVDAKFSTANSLEGKDAKTQDRWKFEIKSDSMEGVVLGSSGEILKKSKAGKLKD